MKRYIYPQNLKATANIWFWSLKDFAIIAISLLISVFVIAKLGFVLPAALTLAYGFLTIRYDEATVLDFIKNAVKYFITTQQYYEWR